MLFLSWHLKQTCPRGTDLLSWSTRHNQCPLGECDWLVAIMLLEVWLSLVALHIGLQISISTVDWMPAPSHRALPLVLLTYS